MTTKIEKPKGAQDAPLVIDDSNPKEIPFLMSTHLSRMEKKYAENHAKFMRPTGWISPAGEPNPRFDRQRREDWEYVVGIVEAKEGISSLGMYEMDWCKWAGDAITTWKIPTGVPVAIPRGLANHIRNENKWTAYISKTRQATREDSHGDYLTTWKAEEIRRNTRFELIQDLT